MAAPEWKVLLIGGGVGTGKSTLALQLSHIYEAPVLDGDDLRFAVESAVAPGSDPNLHIFREPGFWERSVKENLDRMLALSKRLCEISEAVVARRHFVGRPVIIEAVWLLPEFASQSRFNDVSMENEVRSLFLFEADRELLRQRLIDRDGERALPDDQLSRFDAVAGYGRVVAERASGLGLPVLDSSPLETLLSRSVDALA